MLNYSVSSGGSLSARKTQFIRMTIITSNSKYLETTQSRKTNLHYKETGKLRPGSNDALLWSRTRLNYMHENDQNFKNMLVYSIEHSSLSILRGHQTASFGKYLFGGG